MSDSEMQCPLSEFSLTDLINTFLTAPTPPESSVPGSPVDPAGTSPAVDSPPFPQRPVVVPSSAWRSSHVSMAVVAIVLTVAGFIFV